MEKQQDLTPETVPRSNTSQEHFQSLYFDQQATAGGRDMTLKRPQSMTIKNTPDNLNHKKKKERKREAYIFNKI